MRAILELGSVRLGEAEIPFVHEGGRIQEDAPPPSAEPRASELAQLPVGRFHELVGRRGITALGATDQVCQVPPFGHPDIYNISGPS